VTIKPIIASTLFMIFCSTVMSQNPSTKNADNVVGTVSNLYTIQDTVSATNTSLTLKLLWMDSVVEIRKTTSVKYDLEYARKFRKDPTYFPTPTDTISHNEMMRISSQNCHSYALEKYFIFYGIKESLLFTDKTIVTENVYMGRILSTAFKKNQSINTKPKKNLKNMVFDKGRLLVFRNKSGVAIHSVFYDGEYHSKYGGWAAKAEKTLKPVFQKYWDTILIEEYQLDTSKINNYLARLQN
jgi:hypothetical protein